MNEQNLIPKDLSKRPNHKELSAKGGRAKTKAKKHSAQLRGIKLAETDARKEELIHKLVTDPDFSAKYLTKLASQLWDDLPKIARTKVLQNMINIHKLSHGEKKTIEVQGNLNLAQEIKQYLKEDGWENKTSSQSSNINPTLDNKNSIVPKQDSERLVAEDDGENH